MKEDSLVYKALLEALKMFRALRGQGRNIEHVGTGFGEVGTDTEIAADRILGEAMRHVLSERPYRIISVEGLPDLLGELSVGSDRMRVADPLDGSLNFLRSNGSVSLPYSAVAAEYIVGVDGSRFSDCLDAGVIDLRTGDLWFAQEGRMTLNGLPIKTSGMTTVDKAEGTTLIGEFYYPENRERLVRAFADFRGYLRNPGSAGYELALVASGQADAFVCDRQKNDVLGAGYRLITDAGGYVCDFDGNELGAKKYVFDAQQLVVAAATRELALEIVERLRRQ